MRRRQRPLSGVQTQTESQEASALTGGGSGSVSSGASKRRRSKYCCQPCFESRIKCDGKLPCSACFLRCRPCRPKRQPGEPSRQSGGPLIECILSRMDPLEIATIYKEAFHVVFREGVIDRRKTILLLREWAAMSAIAGCDVSWGIGATITSAMDITPLELEDSSALILDFPGPAQRERAEMAVRASMAASQALKATGTFRAFDDGVNPMFMIMHEAPHLVGVGDGRYRSVRATNRAYETWFHLAASELVSSMLQRKMLGSMLSAILVDPLDRLAYLVSTVRTLFASDQGSSTQLLKCQTRKGSIRVYLFKMMRTRVDGRDTTVLAIESMPTASRYVTNCPDIRKRINSFRQEELPPEEEEDAAVEKDGDAEHDHPEASWDAVLQQVAELCDEGGAAWSPSGPWFARASPAPSPKAWGEAPSLPSPWGPWSARASPAPSPAAWGEAASLPSPPPPLSHPAPGRFMLPASACVPTSDGLQKGEAILEAKGAEGVSALFNPGAGCKPGHWFEAEGPSSGATGSGGISRG